MKTAEDEINKGWSAKECDAIAGFRFCTHFLKNWNDR